MGPFFFVQKLKKMIVMKTGFSLCSISNREKPVFITWEPCSGPVLALYGIAVYLIATKNMRHPVDSLYRHGYL